MSGGTSSLLDLSKLLALEKTLTHGPTEGMLGMDLAGAAPLTEAASLAGGAGPVGAAHQRAARGSIGGTGSLLDLSELPALEQTLADGPTEGRLEADLAGAATLAGAASAGETDPVRAAHLGAAHGSNGGTESSLLGLSDLPALDTLQIPTDR